MPKTYIAHLDMKPLIGRENGQNAAKIFNLKEKEALFEIIEVHIPTNAYVISRSFFLGFFGDSAERIKDKTLFSAKYKLKFDPFLQEVIDLYIQRLFSNIK